ncbi:MAG TPA: hypothetical protein VFB60_16440 [Ktedonobacteraceae bacterium]|nr:hypothetical protein [Ktedonobacteraceae bacterium]
MFILSLLPFIFFVIYLAGAALIVYILILLVQVLRLSIRALQKYLQ